MGLIRNLWSSCRESNLRRKGFVPPAEAQIPQTGTHYVIESCGVRTRSAEIYRDGEVIYSVHYNERSGSISDIRFAAPNGDKFDWGYSGYGAHDIKVDRSNGTTERACRNTDMDHPYVSDNAESLFAEYERARAPFKALAATLPIIRIVLPDEDSPKAARNMGWKKVKYESAKAAAG